MLTITKTSQMSPFHDCNMASGLNCVMLFCWLFSYVLKIIDQQFHPYHQASLPWCHVTLDISARITYVITLMFTHWSNRNYARNYVMVVYLLSSNLDPGWTDECEWSDPSLLDPAVSTQAVSRQSSTKNSPCPQRGFNSTTAGFSYQ